MKLNRTWAMAVAIVMALTLSLSGTLAYLSDTDQDVNVMTLGNVHIEQHEYERDVYADGTYKTDTIDGMESYVLKEFTQGKALLPIVGDPSLPGNNPGYAGYDNTIVRMTQVDSYGTMQVFAGKNAQDKFVTVENTGKSDAYVRTIVAIEVGTGDASLIGIGSRCVPSEKAAADTAPWVSYSIGTVGIDDNNYKVFEYVYRGASDVQRHVNGVLPAGDTTYPNLCQVYLKSATTNEDVEAIDGNDNGMLDILVVTQAVQAAGFDSAEDALDTAFGEISATNHPWMKGVEPVVAIVSSDEELNAALEDPTVSEIVLNSGNYGVIDVRVNRTLTISAAADADVTIAGVNGQTNNNTNLTIKGVTIDNSKQTEGWFTGTAQNIKPCVGVWGGNYTFENCTFHVTGESGAETGVMSWWTTNHGVMNFKNCTFKGGNEKARGMQIYGNYDLNVEGCTFNTAKDYSIKYVGSEGCAAVLKNNTVNATTNFVQLGSAPYAGENYSITFEGNSLDGEIKHVYIENAENQTITINGVVKPAIDEEIY